MNTLVAYYSVTKNNQKLAQVLAEKLKGDLEEISDGKPFSLLRDGFLSVFKFKTKVHKPTHDLLKYDVVIVCTPIRIGNLPAQTRGFLAQYSNQIKKAAYVSVCSTNNPNAIQEFKKLTNQPNTPSLELVYPPIKVIDPKTKQEIPKGYTLTQKDLEDATLQRKITAFIDSLKRA